MQTVTASAQGMVSQANKRREGKEGDKTRDWSSSATRFSNLPLRIIPAGRSLHLSFDFQGGSGGFNTTGDDDKTTQRNARAELLLQTGDPNEHK